ncbi:hypothetical protein E2C01_059211 [Portunus trituberculatus]|uniref:Uncharacterized protein n=1 Tax=Portunus trituberculatus TaxID=210409 RepID=A0A5B7H674_PORTR|nr:hypothetical protein [Portunus trituberculatus]
MSHHLDCGHQRERERGESELSFKTFYSELDREAETLPWVGQSRCSGVGVGPGGQEATSGNEKGGNRRGGVHMLSLSCHHNKITPYRKYMTMEYETVE